MCLCEEYSIRLQTYLDKVNTNVQKDENRLDEKNQKWDVQRAQTQFLEEMIDQLISEKLKTLSPKDSQKILRWRDRLYECSGWLEFTKLKHEDEAGRIRLLHRASFCRVRFCPICQGRRSMKSVARMFNILPEIEEKYPASKFALMTLTVLNCDIENLRDTINMMNKGWYRMARTKKFKRAIQGYIKSIEVTRGDDNSAHPHFHILLMLPKRYFQEKKLYYTHQELVELWKKSCRLNYSPNVDIRRCKGDLKKSVVETTKYATKPEDLFKNKYWFLEYIFQVERLRFFSTGGVLKDLLKGLADKREKKKQEDLIHIDENEKKPEDENIEGLEMFNWNRNIKHFVKEEDKK